jgi:SAM-dependent methyltransferase
MNLRALAKRLPSPLYRLLRRVHGRVFGYSRPAGARLGPAAGPLLTEVAPRLAAIPGWFNLDDMAHFQLILGTQAAAGLTGDLLEIGCFHGRSAVLLALHLRAGERLLLCDAFGLAGAEPYGDTPTPEQVRRNLARAVPALDMARVSLLRSLSRNLNLPPDTRLRFAHVDGSHAQEDALADLELCARHLVPGGIIAVDDYRHPDYPGVTAAADEFLAGHRSFRVLADLNRAGALGRKLYLRNAAAETGAPEG